MTMTFEEFQATWKYTDDLRSAIADWQYDDTGPGYYYLDGSLHIDVVTQAWPEEARERGKWHLIIAASANRGRGA
jgi:hypothetical protein